MTTASVATTEPSAESPRVAVLGVGTMGGGMAESLLRAGFTTALWNRDVVRLGAFEDRGAALFDAAPDASRDADIVITMVTDADAVIDIADGNHMLDALRPGATWVQMSTIGVAGFERVAALVAARRPDVMFVDAPVTGSRDAAESGSLTIFASGPAEAMPRLEPVFDALGRRTLWLGAAGLGTRLKLANNAMIAFIVQGLREAITVAHHLGLTTFAVREAFEGASFASPYVSGKLARIERGNYDPEFSLELALKDVKLALDAIDVDHHPVLHALATEWQDANGRGVGSLDLTAITRVLDERF
jgi:3-hydroxyisobutyrate dehydrogenase